MSLALAFVKSKYSQLLEKASVVESSDQAPTVIMALGSVRLIAAACLLMNLNILNIGIAAPAQPAPEPWRIVVLKQGLASPSILTEPSGSFMISQEPKACLSLKAETIG